MTASFPNGIASFTPKRDNLDTNYANDINRLQDEIVAIEQALGVLINKVTDLSIEVTTDEQQVAQYETQTTTEFASLADRLNWLQAGYHIRAAHVAGSDFLVSPVDVQSDIGATLKMSAPTNVADPYGLWNGSGLTLNKSGFWILNGFVRFDVGDTTKHGSTGAWGVGQTDNANWNKKNAGTYQASINTGSNWHEGADRKQVSADGGYWPNVFLNPIRMGYFDAGTKVHLHAAHDSAQKQHVFNAYLNAVWVRSPSQPVAIP